MYHLRDVIKTREAEGMAFRLRVPSLQIARGEKIALTGESGCGKSTLLDMLAFILKPSDTGAFCFRPDCDREPVDVNANWKAGKLNQLGDLTVFDRTRPEELVSRAAGADILIVNKIALGTAQFEQLTRLRLVAVTATGASRSAPTAMPRAIPVLPA